MPKEIIPAKMEMHLQHIEASLKVALQQNATGMLEVIRKSTQKMLDEHTGCKHRAYSVISERCQKMLDAIDAYTAAAEAAGNQSDKQGEQPDNELGQKKTICGLLLHSRDDAHSRL